MLWIGSSERQPYYQDYIKYGDQAQDLDSVVLCGLVIKSRLFVRSRPISVINVKKLPFYNNV